jgi:hypothetical protein
MKIADFIIDSRVGRSIARSALPSALRAGSWSSSPSPCCSSTGCRTQGTGMGC